MAVVRVDVAEVCGAVALSAGRRRKGMLEAFTLDLLGT
jgi:hypothetical protein